MKEIYLVMRSYYETADISPVQAFEDDDEASMFCREKNSRSYDTFYIQAIKFKEKENK